MKFQNKIVKVVWFTTLFFSIATQSLLAQNKEGKTKRAEVVTSDSYGISKAFNLSSLSELQKMVLELYKYTESYNYEELTDSQRRTLLENFAERQQGSRKLIDPKTGLDVFKVVDAYIKADKGLPVDRIKLSAKHKKDLEEFEKKAQEENDKANKALDMIKSFYNNQPSNDEKLQQLKSTSTEEIKELETLLNLKQANDYKKLQTGEKSAENIVLAINIVKESKDYEAFRTAAKFLKPELSEEEIKEMWHKKSTK